MSKAIGQKFIPKKNHEQTKQINKHENINKVTSLLHDMSIKIYIWKNMISKVIGIGYRNHKIISD